MIQRWTGTRWANAAPVARTGPSGTFLTNVAAPRGTKLRLRALLLSYESPTLVVS